MEEGFYPLSDSWVCEVFFLEDMFDKFDSDNFSIEHFVNIFLAQIRIIGMA